MAKNSCKSCMYSRHVLGNVVGHWEGICLHSPPQVVVVPMISPLGKRTLQITPMFPPVAEEMACGQFIERPETETETPGA